MIDCVRAISRFIEKYFFISMTTIEHKLSMTKDYSLSQQATIEAVMDPLLH